MNKRVFIEKKQKFDLATEKLQKELLDYFQFENLKIYTVYDVFGIEESALDVAVDQVFSNPVTDISSFDFKSLGFDLAVEYLPGQYDQRAYSAEQCLQILGTVGVKVRSSMIYSFSNLCETDREGIEKYLINPIEKRVKDLSVLVFPESTERKEIKTIDGFSNLSVEGLVKLSASLDLSMHQKDIVFIQDHFKEQQRDPTEAELKILDTYWSDHCRHTTFETILSDILWEDENGIAKRTFDQYLQIREELKISKPIRLMDLATIATKYLYKNGMLDNLDQSKEINACSVVVPIKVDGKEEEWLLQFKNETHNHPTEVEPYGGASTCIGGAIRDPLAGRAFVYQAMRVTGAADPLEKLSDTMPGKLPQRKITQEAARGYSDYGNQIGVPTTLVHEFYHPGYKAKRMEVGFVVGAVPKKWVKREEPKKGDVVVLLGGRTGRDGIGGAVGSSKTHNGKNLENLSAQVQKGNPIVEGKIQRLFRKEAVINKIIRCNDFGAGGISVAIGEIADSILIDLNKVRTKYDGLNGMELALAESQERMALVLDSSDLDFFVEEANKENLEAYEVARVTDSGKMIMQWNGKDVASLERAFLETNGVQHTARVEVEKLNELFTENISFDKTSFLSNLSSLQNASQINLKEMFDSNIGRSTVLSPLGGLHQDTPEDVSVNLFPTHGETNNASMSSFGFDPFISSQNTYLGAYYAVLESVSKLIVAGADLKEIRLSFQEYFERLDDNPKKWGKPFTSLLGALKAQLQFGVAAIGGKDSMSGSFQDIHVPPTLISFAIAPILKEKVISASLFNCAANLYAFIPPLDSNGLIENDVFIDFIKLYTEIKKDKVLSSGVVHKDGIAYTIAKMAFGNEVGLEINSKLSLNKFHPGAVLFQTNAELNNIPKKLSNFLSKIGETNISQKVVFGKSENQKGRFELTFAEMKQPWKETLEPIFSSYHNKETKIIAPIPYINKKINLKPSKTANPSVFIPAFPGTNSEFDSAKAFKIEGAKIITSVFRNLSEKSISQSIIDFTEQLKKSEILFIPGGFSVADEPDGSGKFIATILRNEKVANAIHDLLERDGLILGICNGFQALMQSGLLPHGKVSEELQPSDPTLHYNNLARHISKIVKVKVNNDFSPWLKGMKDQVFHMPISHGEGRFLADEKTMKELLDSGQIASQYVDLKGNASVSQPYNPNGSLIGIEGITSKCGRVYGKMGHPERFEKGLFKNIPEFNQMNIFKNAVSYFKG